MSGELLVEPEFAAYVARHELARGVWHVLQTKPRGEKALSFELSAMGIHNELPLICQERYFGRRRALVEVPMLPGFVFILGNEAHLNLACQTLRVLQTIKVADQESLRWTLNNLRLLSHWNVELSNCSPVGYGRRVEVTSGALRGVQGLVGESCDRLVFQVDGSLAAVGVKLSGQTLAFVACTEV